MIRLYEQILIKLVKKMYKMYSQKTELSEFFFNQAVKHIFLSIEQIFSPIRLFIFYYFSLGLNKMKNVPAQPIAREQHFLSERGALLSGIAVSPKLVKINSKFGAFEQNSPYVLAESRSVYLSMNLTQNNCGSIPNSELVTCYQVHRNKIFQQQ